MSNHLSIYIYLSISMSIYIHIHVYKYVYINQTFVAFTFLLFFSLKYEFEKNSFLLFMISMHHLKYTRRYYIDIKEEYLLTFFLNNVFH